MKGLGGFHGGVRSFKLVSFVLHPLGNKTGATIFDDSVTTITYWVHYLLHLLICHLVIFFNRWAGSFNLLCNTKTPVVLSTSYIHPVTSADSPDTNVPQVLGHVYLSLYL